MKRQTENGDARTQIQVANNTTSIPSLSTPTVIQRGRIERARPKAFLCLSALSTCTPSINSQRRLRNFDDDDVVLSEGESRETRDERSWPSKFGSD